MKLVPCHEVLLKEYVGEILKSFDKFQVVPSSMEVFTTNLYGPLSPTVSRPSEGRASRDTVGTGYRSAYLVFVMTINTLTLNHIIFILYDIGQTYLFTSFLTMQRHVKWGTRKNNVYKTSLNLNDIYLQNATKSCEKPMFKSTPGTTEHGWYGVRRSSNLPLWYVVVIVDISAFNGYYIEHFVWNNSSINGLVTPGELPLQ